MNKNTSTNAKKKKNKNRQQSALKMTVIFSGMLAVVLFAVILNRLCQNRYNAGKNQRNGQALQGQEGRIPRPELDVELLTVNEYSRPAAALKKVKGVVIHYTANPGTDALANRNYFEGLKDSHVTKASSHFVIGLDGAIVQCIPSTEIACCGSSDGMAGGTFSIGDKRCDSPFRCDR